jgi:hypothetical protein
VASGVRGDIVKAVRVELKYAVPEDLAVWALQWSGVFLERDFGLTGPQKVTSLYLDTPSLAFFRWHREARPDRFKLRIRGYGDGNREFVWAEIKRKAGSVVYKQRAALPVRGLDSVLREDPPLETSGFGDTELPALRDFVRRRFAFHAEPKLLIKCQRDALREKGPAGEIAITVDRCTVYQPTRRHDLVDDPNLWRTVVLPASTGPATAIIELKYMRQAPTWMKTLMLKLAPHRVQFSKYRAAMQQHTRMVRL